MYGDENIKVVYNNKRSYRKHSYDIKDNHNLLAADIIFLAETRFTLYDKTENYPIENFHAYQMDQQCASKPYHGLIMYIHNNIQLLNITMFPGKDIEAIQVVIKKFSKVFTIIGLYSSPHTTVEQIHTFVDNMLSNANDQPIIMIGDFNIDLSVKRNTSFCKFMKSKYNLDQYMKQYTTKYQTTIDLLFSNYPHLNVSSVYSYWSDHYLIYGIIGTVS